MQTSADFRAQHTILSSRKILHLDPSPGQDFLDLNRNDLVDCHGRAKSVMCSYDEPALTTSLQDVAAFGARRGTEVVTGEQLQGKLKAQYMQRDTYDDSPRCWRGGGTVDLDEVATRCESLESNVKWAIDTQTHEFLLYQDK